MSKQSNIYFFKYTELKCYHNLYTFKLTMLVLLKLNVHIKLNIFLSILAFRSIDLNCVV